MKGRRENSNMNFTMFLPTNICHSKECRTTDDHRVRIDPTAIVGACHVVPTTVLKLQNLSNCLMYNWSTLHM